MSTESGARHVSLQPGRRLIIYNHFRLLSKLSGSPNQTIKNYYTKQAGLEHEVITVPFADGFTSLQIIRREAYVWITLSHVNILSFEGIINDFGQLPALVSLWMENGSLNVYLKNMFPSLSSRRKLELVSV